MTSLRLVEVAQWLGQDAAPLDPATMQYRARPTSEGAAQCSGCLFKGQRASVCMVACAAAVRAGLPDCDERDSETGRTFIYTLVQVDPRQVSIIK